MSGRPRQMKKGLPAYLPGFVSQDVYLKMYRLLPKIYFKRFSTYFKRYGCLRCSRKRTLYGANGLCLHCLGLVSDRLKACDRVLVKRCSTKNGLGRSDRFLRRVDSARRLLSDLVVEQTTRRQSNGSVAPPANLLKKVSGRLETKSNPR
jgi:hypothetical protein